MANSNFVVQNGLTIGPLTIDAITGSISTTGNITTTGTTTTFINEIVTGTEAVYGQLSANAGIGSSSTSTGTFIVTGGTGITGDVFVGGNVHTTGTAYLKIPAGTTAQRPGSANVQLGMIRYNSSISSFEGYGAGSAWSSLGGVKSVDGFATITAEASAGAGDDVLRFYSGSTGSQVQVAWASAGNVSILPATVTSSPTTGALQVAGGVGIVGSLQVGGTISAPTIGNTGATLTGTLSTATQNSVTTMTGLTGFGTAGVTTTAAGNFTITGCLTVNGTTTTINNTTVETTEYVSTIDATTVRATTLGNTGATLTGTLSTAAQTNITSVGTLTGLTVSGAIVPNGNLTVNLGSTTAWWNNIYGTAIHSLYADLAENYVSDKPYPAGTVLMFGGEKEVTVADVDTSAVAGIVSTNPSHLMNGGLTGANIVPLALTGRVPCMIIGPVKKGDLLVSAGYGYAKASSTPGMGTVVGKSLVDFPSASKATIEVAVGRY